MVRLNQVDDSEIGIVVDVSEEGLSKSISVLGAENKLYEINLHVKISLDKFYDELVLFSSSIGCLIRPYLSLESTIQISDVLCSQIPEETVVQEDISFQNNFTGVSLYQPILNHGQPRLWNCKFCEAVFSTYEVLKLHMRSHGNW